MKTFSAFASLAVLGCVALAPCALGQADSEKAGGAVTNAAGRIPKSVFDESIGKDPFFPRRSLAPVPQAAVSEARVTDFTLNGITPLGARPTAIINGKTFEKGESGEVKVPSGGKVMIRCVEIKEGTVSIMIENSPRPIELRMRPGF